MSFIMAYDRWNIKQIKLHESGRRLLEESKTNEKTKRAQLPTWMTSDVSADKDRRTLPYKVFLRWQQRGVTLEARHVHAPRVRHYECHGTVRVHDALHFVDDLVYVGVGRLAGLEEPLLRADGHDDELGSVAEGEIIEGGSRGVERGNVV